MSRVRRKNDKKNILRYTLTVIIFMLEENTYSDEYKYDVTFKILSSLSPFSSVHSPEDSSCPLWLQL